MCWHLRIAPASMLIETEERSFKIPDRQAMERELEDVHRRLDEYEEALAAYCSAVPYPRIGEKSQEGRSAG